MADPRSDGPRADHGHVESPSDPRQRGMPLPESRRDGATRDAKGSALGPVRSVSVLLGAAISLTTVGLIARFETVFFIDDGSGVSVAGLVLGVVFVALSVGMRIPRRFALWACSAAWRKLRYRRAEPDPPNEWLRPREVDRSLHWMVLAVIALTAGVLTALLPIGAFVGAASYEWMHRHFVWSSGPLVALQILTLFLAAALPLTLFGLATSGAHRMSCPSGGWEPSATGWILGGAGVGALAGGTILRAHAPPDLLLVSAALPALAMTLLAVFRGTSPRDERGVARLPDPSALPMCSDPWPRLLRGALVAVEVCGFGVAMVWVGFDASVAFPESVRPAAALLLAGGAGTLAGCRHRQDGHRTIGGFGAACAAAGVTIALGLSLVMGYTLISTDSTRLPAALVSLAVVAYAAAYGRRTLLGRVARRPLVGTTILTRTLAGSALLVWIIAPMLALRTGSAATLLGFALVLLALGGTLIIHEPGYSPGRRRVRLCAVFASIGAMITVVLIRS